MIAAILIRGTVTARKQIRKALYVMKLRKKFSMRLFENKENNMKMLKKVENYVMYGEISKELVQEIIKKFGEKDVYHLHPPVGGFKKSIKLLYPQGETGKRSKEDMENYIRRMMV